MSVRLSVRLSVKIGCVDRELEFFKSAEVSLLARTEIDDYFFVHMSQFLFDLHDFFVVLKWN